MRLACTLPFPPSVNHMYQPRSRGRYMSKAARAFREHAVVTLRTSKPQGWESDGLFALWIGLIVPDRRRRDIDNHVKAVQDAIQAAGLVDDDTKIVHTTVELWGVERGGAAYIRLCHIKENVPSEEEIRWLACLGG